MACRRARAFVPTRRADRDLTLDARTVADAASRLYTSAKLLGLTGSNPLRA